jgi:hypothetical protein
MTMRIELKQKGIAIVTVLVMMVAVSLLGISVVNMSNLEERISGNFQLVTESFELAEAGISGAMSLREQANTPFKGAPTLTEYDPDNKDQNGNPIDVSVDPFSSVNPISGLHGVSAGLTLICSECLAPRVSGFSTAFGFDWYRVESRHQHAGTGVEREVTQYVARGLAPDI